MAQTVEAKQVVLKDSEGGYLLPYAGVAQKALKDNDGNDIPTTYAKRADLNGYLPVDGKAVDSAKADTATSAASATKATQDSAGQQINTTYIKNVSVNGRTITFTRGDGKTFTITTQDTVTTNSSNWSVSNGTNGWATSFDERPDICIHYWRLSGQEISDHGLNHQNSCDTSGNFIWEECNELSVGNVRDVDFRFGNSNSSRLN